MNRVSGDYFESLLYTLFVSADERTSVEKLSLLLDIDIELVKVFFFFFHSLNARARFVFFDFFFFLNLVRSRFFLASGIDVHTLGFRTKKKRRATYPRKFFSVAPPPLSFLGTFPGIFFF